MGKKKSKKKKTEEKREDKNTNNGNSQDETIHELAKLEKLRGNQDFQKENYHNAIMSYTKAIALSKNPNLLASLFTNRAISRLRSQDFKGAVEDSLSALKLDSGNWKAFACRGFAFLYLADFDKSIIDLDSVIKMHPDKSGNIQQNLKKLKDIITQKKKEGIASKTAPKAPIPDIRLEFGLLNIEDQSGFTKPPGISVTSKSGSEKESLDLPLLIPIGEALSTGGGSMSHFEVPRNEAEELALKEKENGNKAFSENNYQLALEHYSRAIRLDWREPVFFSNRALVYLKLNRFHEAITDCTASLDRKQSIKAFARRAAAWAALEEYFLAAEDYKRALKFEPRNQDCLCELEKCLVRLEIDYVRKLGQESDNEKLKKSLHNVREDIKKIATKIDSTVAMKATQKAAAQTRPGGM